MRRGVFKGKPARGAKRERRKFRAAKTYAAINLTMTNRWFTAYFIGMYDTRTFGKSPKEAEKALGWKRKKVDDE